ncbi:MAG: Trk system potassium transporter TrkA [Planctomycetota bacterium]
MNIVILGAGRIGSSIAEILCDDEHNVTIVDNDPVHIARVNDELDVRAIHGGASQSSILFQSGISNADICLAVTGDDETNIIAASMAKAMGAKKALARVYAPVFRDLSTFDYQSHFNIDRMLSIEHLAAMELASAIRDPGAVVVEHFARGELEAQMLVVKTEGKVTQVPLRELGLPSTVRVGTIARDNVMKIASAEDQLQNGDEVTVFSRPEDRKSVRSRFTDDPGLSRRVVIAGGGETGFHLARVLEREGFKVLIMETNAERCTALAHLLETTKIINCDAARRENLEEEHVGSADVFVACTGRDEDNLVLAVAAAELGTDQVMTVIGNPNYADFVGKLGVSNTVSKRDVMARQVVAYLTRGDVISSTRLPGGLINLVEMEVAINSHATTGTLADLDLPDRCLIVAIIQQDYVRMPTAADKLEAGNTVIVLVEDDVMDSAIGRFTVSD